MGAGGSVATHGDLRRASRAFEDTRRAATIHREPPRDRGVLLEEIPYGADGSLHISYIEDDGRAPALNIRLWRTGIEGYAYPVSGVGVAIQGHRLSALADALIRAMELWTERLERDRRAR